MAIALTDEQGLRELERGIVGLVEQSALQRADHLLKQAIDEYASEDLRRAAETPARTATIDGWEHLCADMLEVDDNLRKRGDPGVAMVRISLVNRQEGDRQVGELRVERRFYKDSALCEYGIPAGLGLFPMGMAERPVRLTGLKAVMAIQRRWVPPGGIRGPEGFQWQIDHTLSGLLLILRYQQAVDRFLNHPGLPIAASLFVEMDHVAWPMEAGVVDFGPQARRHIAQEEHAPKPLNAAAEILAERSAERTANYQALIAETVAELREHYRLVRMFPFYRFRDRRKLGEMLDSRLGVACRAQGLPVQGVGWRMSKREFENFLLRWVQARNPDSVEDALDTRHVDSLHERWLKSAREENFQIGSAPLSLFALNLAWALKFGGPIVQDRWEHAGPYRLER